MFNFEILAYFHDLRKCRCVERIFFVIWHLLRFFSEKTILKRRRILCYCSTTISRHFFKMTICYQDSHQDIFSRYIVNISCAKKSPAYKPGEICFPEIQDINQLIPSYKTRYQSQLQRTSTIGNTITVLCLHCTP